MQVENYFYRSKICPQCLLEFLPTGRNHKYCTPNCQTVANANNNKASVIRHQVKIGVQVGVGSGGLTGSGKSNPAYKNGRGTCNNRRAETKKIQRYCNHCGKDLIDATHYQWAIHHKDHNKYNNPEDGSNWVLLCRRCHQIEHKCWRALEGATTSLIRLPNGRYSNPNKRSSQEGSEVPGILTVTTEG
jgi:hypothetical protein